MEFKYYKGHLFSYVFRGALKPIENSTDVALLRFRINNLNK